MKSVYACSKPDGTLALAIDIVAIEDTKVIGALLKLAGESGLVIDRVERDQVEFMDPIMIRSLRDTRREDKRQLEIDFSQSGEKVLGIAELCGTCNFSGPCPNEKLSCNNCEHWDSGIPATVAPFVDETPEQPSEITAEQGAEWAEKMQQAAAGEEIPEPEEVMDYDPSSEEPEEDDPGDDEDLKFEGQEEELPF